MENADCWCRKATTQENRVEVQEESWCWKAVTRQSRMEAQEVRMLTAGAGRLILRKAEWRCRKGEC